MRKLSGLIFDQYDDVDGEVLRSIFPSEDGIPDFVKQAHRMTADEQSSLPANVFALELVDGSTVMRKFACIDGGNTALSVEYFFKTAHKLPEFAQRTVAENLVTACGWYDIDPPDELQKVALGMGTVMAGMMLPSVAKSTKMKIDRNQALSGASGGAVNPQLLNPKPVVQGV